MEDLLPKKIFFTKGVGTSKEQLQSFEMALRGAGIEKCNLVNVSSIFPPHCKIIGKSEGIKLLHPGEITFCVMGKITTNEPHRLMSVSIGLAIPADRSHYGYLSEHEAYGLAYKKAADHAEDLAATMLATTLGIAFDPNKNYDERREIYKMSGKIIETSSITQTAIGHHQGYWTTAVVAAVFIIDR